MKWLYKVPFSGFFIVSAESAEDAKSMSKDDPEVIYSEESNGDVETCPDGVSVPIDDRHYLFIEPTDEEADYATD